MDQNCISVEHFSWFAIIVVVPCVLGLAIEVLQACPSKRQNITEPNQIILIQTSTAEREKYQLM